MLQKLKLSCFRNHQNVELVFEEGVNAIIGRNGSGKSSVLEAIEFLCTGRLMDPKESCITEGGTVGYVYGEFLVDGKVAKIRRSLNESKTTLEYDGKKYSKAADVKNLWAQLFQIDDAIVSNVIIAHQKDIPMLFSGDDRIREAIFQKIFLVPNTNKLRSLIWDEYLKKAPAEYYVEPPEAIKAKEGQVQALVAERQKLDAEMLTQKASLLSAEDKQRLVDQLVSYRQMEKNLLEVPRLEGEIREQDRQITACQSEQVGLTAQLQGLDAGLFLKKRASLNDLRSKFVTRNNYLKQIDDLKKLINNSPFDQKEYDSVMQQYEEWSHISSGLVHKQEALKKSLATLTEAQKQGKLANCPTCFQSITDFASLVERFKSDLTTTEKYSSEARAMLQNLTDRKTNLLRQKEKTDRLSIQLNTIEEQAKGTEEVQFDENLLKILDEAEGKFLVNKKRHDELSNVVSVAQSRKQELEKRLASCKNVEPDFNVKLEGINSRLQANEKAEEYHNDQRLKLNTIDQNIITLNNSLNENRLHQAENEKRAGYVQVLQKLYDVFHTSCFPRKLAQTYVEEVERQLCRFLAKFNFRYRAKVLDSFKIQMITDSGFVLPRVSGGQEMVVGLCLRMALHAMFSQSFPMLIIDEGTTHMDMDENRPLYFEIIKGLRQELGIKQLIVIDHDAQLAAVSDHTIQL